MIDDLVIISGVMTQYGDNAVPAHRFVAFDKRSGAAVWFLSTQLVPEDTTYFDSVSNDLQMAKRRWSSEPVMVSSMRFNANWQSDLEIRSLEPPAINTRC